MGVIQQIPLFPPFCVAVIPEGQCAFLGITFPCVPAVTGNTPFAQGTEQGHVFVAVVLLCFATLAISYNAYPWQWGDTMKVTVGLYTLVTACFAIIRHYWGLGTRLLIGAALHNLFEWYIVIQLSHGIQNFRDLRKALGAASLFIVAVVLVALFIPGVKASFIVEQTTGLMLDWGMALMFVSQHWCMDNNEEVREFFRLPAYAHVVHVLCTIVPLVYANFHVGYPSWYSSVFLEGIILISVIFTHMCYLAWANGVDRRKDPNTHILPEKYLIRNVSRYLLAGFFIGLFCLLIFPKFVMGACSTKPECHPDGRINGISVAKVHPGYGRALEDLVASTKLVETARKTEGLLSYEFVKDLTNPDEYRFIEKWQSQEHLQEWLSGYPREIFASAAMKGLLVGEKVEVSGFTTPTSSSCRLNEEGAISFNVTGTCDQVWDVVGNWKDCSWVMGCTHVAMEEPLWEAGPRDLHRIMHMGNGQKIDAYLLKRDAVLHTLAYKYTTPSAIAGYVGSVALKPSDDAGCSIYFKFSIPHDVEMTVELDYHLLYESRLDFLKEMFSRESPRCGLLFCAR